jgi:hypothetical protein
MGTAFSIAILMVILLRYVFGYIWDTPLAHLRKTKISKIHQYMVPILLVLTFYIYYPLRTAAWFNIPPALITTISVLITLSASFMFYYANNTNESRPVTKYDEIFLKKWINHLIRVVLLAYCITLFVIFFLKVCNFGGVISCILGCWLGVNAQLMIWVETHLVIQHINHKK